MEEYVPPSETLCADFISYIQDVRGFSPATVRSYAYMLNRFLVLFNDWKITDITIEQVDHCVVTYTQEQHIATSSANTLRCVLRAFFLYVDKYRGIRLRFDYSMIRQQKSPDRKIEFVTLEKCKEIISKLKTDQDKLMATTIFATGMRIGELIKLNVEDLRQGEIVIRGKGGKVRPIPIDDHLDVMLKKYIQDNNIRTGPIFRHQETKTTLVNQAYTVSGVRKRWQRQLGPLGLYIKPHAFRHGVATLLLQQGMDIRTLQTFLGHSHIATTMLYTHVTNDHLKKSYAQHFPSGTFFT